MLPSRKKTALLGFCEDESGSFSIEAVIWTPIFIIMLAIMINVSTVFFNESQVLRVVQDANRAYSLGRLETEQETESYVLAQLAHLNAAFTVETTKNGGVIYTTARVPATDLMPMNLMSSVFNELVMNISSQQLIEY